MKERNTRQKDIITDIMMKTKNKKYLISNYSPLIRTKEYLEKLERGSK